MRVWARSISLNVDFRGVGGIRERVARGISAPRVVDGLSLLGQKALSSAALEQLGDLSAHAYLNAQASVLRPSRAGLSMVGARLRTTQRGPARMKLQSSLRALTGTRDGGCS
jgi:hypothetical protein